MACAVARCKCCALRQRPTRRLRACAWCCKVCGNGAAAAAVTVTPHARWRPGRVLGGWTSASSHRALPALRSMPVQHWPGWRSLGHLRLRLRYERLRAAVRRSLGYLRLRLRCERLRAAVRRSRAAPAPGKKHEPRRPRAQASHLLAAIIFVAMTGTPRHDDARHPERLERGPGLGPAGRRPVVRPAAGGRTDAGRPTPARRCAGLPGGARRHAALGRATGAVACGVQRLATIRCARRGAHGRARRSARSAWHIGHPGAGRLPHAPGVRRAARRRIRAPPRTRQLPNTPAPPPPPGPASEDQLSALAMPRLQALLAEGVGAIEIKSGYGLALEHERKQLRVARRLGQACAVTVRTSFLGAHALPPEYAGRSQDYIDLVCQQMLPALAEQGLVDAVDMFCERIAFTLAETEQVFLAAQQLGLPVKLHAGQLSDMGGAALAARYGALSCDHLEHLSADAIAAMQAAGTVAVLLPGAWYTLRGQQRPPIEALRAAGVPMAVATDHNPGSSPALSLLLMAHMACTLFHLSLSEALAGITTHAARALGLQDSHGLIAAGRPANFVLWPLQEAAELVYWLGHKPACTIVRQGRVVRDGLGLLDRPEMPVLRDGA